MNRGRKMRVMFLQIQPCIRALKIARGLKESSEEEISIVLGFLEKTLTELYGYGDEYFDIRERLESAHAQHENVYKKRYDFTIEKNIGNLVEFYRDIIKLRG